MRLRNLFLSFAVLATLFSCAPKADTAADYPMFWTWAGYGSPEKFEELCVAMTESGIDGVLLGAKAEEYPDAVETAKKYGITVHAWVWSMNSGSAELAKTNPEWFSVNRKGASLADSIAYVDYYKFLCPALPEVREHIKNNIRKICEIEGLGGVSIDYHRFVDVVLPTSLWAHYGIVQDREYAEWDYGYHPEMLRLFKEQHGYDPRDQEDPSLDVKWRDFRCGQISEVANEIAEVVHSYGKKMTASPFPTPAMSSRMVRQNWSDWNLDFVFPMVYSDFYTADPTFVSDCTVENVATRNPNTILGCGLLGDNDPERMIAAMDAALNNGAEAIAIYTVGELKSPESRAAFKNYADSMRLVRAAGKLSKKVVADTALNRNPFNNKGITDMMKEKMQGYVSIADFTKSAKKKDHEQIAQISKRPIESFFYAKNIAQENKNADEATEKLRKGLAEQYAKTKIEFTEPVLKNTYDVTKYYIVKDGVSGIDFEVNLYFYGGTFSGWSVNPVADSYAAYMKKK